MNFFKKSILLFFGSALVFLNFNQFGTGDKIEAANQTFTIDALTSTTLVLSSETSYSSGGKNYTAIGKYGLKRV